MNKAKAKSEERVRQLLRVLLGSEKAAIRQRPKKAKKTKPNTNHLLNFKTNRTKRYILMSVQKIC